MQCTSLSTQTTTSLWVSSLWSVRVELYPTALLPCLLVVKSNSLSFLDENQSSLHWIESKDLELKQEPIFLGIDNTTGVPYFAFEAPQEFVSKLPVRNIQLITLNPSSLIHLHFLLFNKFSSGTSIFLSISEFL